MSSAGAPLIRPLEGPGPLSLDLGYKSRTIDQDSGRCGGGSSWAWLGWAAALGPRGLASAFAQPEAVNIYEVFKGDRLVLTVSNQPGPLISTALAPPGHAPVPHPFLSGSAHASEEEASLREILERSKNLPDFIERLQSAGYTLRQPTSAQPSR